MSYQFRPLGMVPSPMDHRDYRLSRIVKVRTSFPPEYTVPTLIPRPYDQGEIGACVAFALKAIKEMQELAERQVFSSFSAAYIYGARDEDDYKGEGMIPREALDILRHRGTCLEELFPGIYPYPVCASKITPEMDRDAKAQRIQTYTAIYTIEEAKTALMELGPLAVGIPVYDSFYQGGHLPLPDTARELLRGYHMMAVVGWTKDQRWLVLNSWGPEWGKLKGYCTLPFNYPITEMWSLTDMKTESQPFYQAYLVSRQSWAKTRWLVHLGVFQTEKEAQQKVLSPLAEDLKRLVKKLVVKKL